MSANGRGMRVDDLLEDRLRIVELVEGDLGDAQVKERGHKVGLELQALPKILSGQFVLTQGIVIEPAVVTSFDVIASQRKRVVESVNRFLLVAAVVQGDAVANKRVDAQPVEEALSGRNAGGSER